jgi:hypothetical protein
MARTNGVMNKRGQVSILFTVALIDSENVIDDVSREDARQ